MSTPDQPAPPQLTRKQLRELRNTASTPIITPEIEAQAAAPVAPLARAADPVDVPEAPVSDDAVDLAAPALTRRQARQQERLRTASVPVITADDVAEHAARGAEADAEDHRETIVGDAAEVAAEVAVETESVVETEAEAEPEAAAEIEVEPEPEAEIEVEPEPAAEVEAEAEVLPEPEPEVEPEAEVELEAEVEPEAEAEHEAEAEPEPEAEHEAEVEHEAEAEPEVELEPEAQGQTDGASDTELAEPDEAEEPSEEVAEAEVRHVVSSGFGSNLLADGGADLELPASFDQLLSRAATTTGSLGVPNALILSQTPETGSLVSPIAATGEVLITGTFALPDTYGSTGSLPGHADGKEVDAVLVDGELPAASSPTPIAASAAISTIKSADDIIRPPAPEKGSKLMMALAITAGVLALALAGVLILAFVTGVL